MRPLLLVSCLLTLSPTLAWSQIMPGAPGGMPGGMPRPTAPGAEEKEEGPAEQAPEEPEKEMPAPTLGFPGQSEKKLQLLQLDGYFRFRSELWHNFHLGFVDTNPVPVGAPFQIPADCFPPTGNNLRGEPANRPCDNGLSTTNMRFRMDPTINVSEQVRVKAQIDVFDNLVLGSTPAGVLWGTAGTQSMTVAPPPGSISRSGLSQTQVPPQAGRNSLTDSIQAKRAWAEVRTPVGELSFGRMPWHWGMGMAFNDGNCLDCDYGTTVDRIVFSAKVADHTVAALLGWASTGPTSDKLAIGLNQFQGQPFDMTNRDDVADYGIIVGKIDKPGEWKEKTDRGETSINYGLYFTYRSQELDVAAQDMDGKPIPNPVPLGSNPSIVGDNLIRANLSLYTPDLWMRLFTHHLLFEAEAVLIAGSYDRPYALTLRQLGGVGRLTYSVLHDSLKLKLEGGYASGDQTEVRCPPGGSGAACVESAGTNYMDQLPIGPGDNTFTAFHFDPDYHIDLILFRRLLGAVTNAIYAKPSLRYDLTESFGGQLDVIASFPAVPVATPGNGSMYGLEIDMGLSYQNIDEGFFATFQYGVLFPASALDQPVGLVPGGIGSASAAQTVRLLLGVKF